MSGSSTCFAMLLAMSMAAVACGDDDSRSDAGELDAEAGDIGHDTGHDVAGADAGIDTHGDAESDDAMATAAACRASAIPVCAALFDCGCVQRLRPWGTEAECVELRVQDCVAAIPEGLTPLLLSGAVEWVRPNVDDCVEELSEQTSQCRFDAQIGHPACAMTLADAAALGESCRAGQPRAFCSAGTGICDDSGVCAPLPRNGENCGELPCATPYVCDLGSCRERGGAATACSVDNTCIDGNVCIDGVCATPAGGSAACLETPDCAADFACRDGQCVELAAPGDGCSSDDDCGNNASCIYNPEGRTCVVGGLPDDACSVATPCMVGNYCDANGHCAPRGEPGAECLDSTMCADSTVCADGVCTPLPAVGELCLQSADAFCAAGLGCNFDTSRCEQGGADGSACLINGIHGYACGAGLGCSFEPEGSFCRPRSPENGPCNSGDSCDDGLYCDYSTLTCEAARSNGESCDGSMPCAAGLACMPRAGGATCQALPARGEACIDSCADGLVCSGFGGLCAPSICGIR